MGVGRAIDNSRAYPALGHKCLTRPTTERPPQCAQPADRSPLGEACALSGPSEWARHGQKSMNAPRPHLTAIPPSAIRPVHKRTTQRRRARDPTAAMGGTGRGALEREPPPRRSTPRCRPPKPQPEPRRDRPEFRPTSTAGSRRFRRSFPSAATTDRKAHAAARARKKARHFGGLPHFCDAASAEHFGDDLAHLLSGEAAGFGPPFCGRDVGRSVAARLRGDKCDFGMRVHSVLLDAGGLVSRVICHAT